MRQAAVRAGEKLVAYGVAVEFPAYIVVIAEKAECRFRQIFKQFEFCLFDVFLGLEGFEMLVVHARKHGVLRLDEAGEIGYVPHVPRAHFRDENIVRAVQLFSGERDAERRVVRFRRGEHAVLLRKQGGEDILHARFAVAARDADLHAVGIFQNTFRAVDVAAVVCVFKGALTSAASMSTSGARMGVTHRTEYIKSAMISSLIKYAIRFASVMTPNVMAKMKKAYVTQMPHHAAGDLEVDFGVHVLFGVDVDDNEEHVRNEPDIACRSFPTTGKKVMASTQKNKNAKRQSRESLAIYLLFLLKNHLEYSRFL